MGVKRHIGEVKELPGLYVELFFGKNKEIVGKLLYEKGTFNYVEKSSLTVETLEFLDNIERKDVKFLRGELFQAFIEVRKRNREEGKKEANEELKTFYCERLYNGDVYLTVQDDEFLARNIIRFHEKDDETEVSFFTEEELDYEDVVYFLWLSSKKEKVTIFINLENMENRKYDSLFTAIYKTKERLYVADVEHETAIRKIRVFNNDMKEVKVEEENEKQLLLAKEKLQNGLLERFSLWFLKNNESVL